LTQITRIAQSWQIILRVEKIVRLRGLGKVNSMWLLDVKNCHSLKIDNSEQSPECQDVASP
jgi:hypothetical protein